MRIKGVNLDWKAIYYDSNSKCIKEFNVFYNGFVEELHKEIIRRKIVDYVQLKEYLRRYFSYHYWCKCEYEVAIGSIFDVYKKDIDKFEKIDVYKQLEINLDRITEYVINELRIKF